ncbi:MAG: hypothetical protein KC420_14950, partial [Myxococcales bacterium]|nr:hypothetical protein [Myxococcales bacterium]
KRGRYVSARNKANDALAVDSNNADAYAVLGAAHWRAGDYEASTKAFKEAIDLDKGNFGALLGLARNYQAAGNHREALELADQAASGDAKQIDPMLIKLWSLYALCDADTAVKVMDDLFQYLGDSPLLPIVQAQAAFMRPLEGKKDLIKVEGEKGTSSAGLDLAGGFKYAGAEIGGDYQPVIFFELREEARIDKGLSKKLGLKSLGKVKPLGGTEEVDLVIVPEVKLGNLKIKNVPALVEDLSGYALSGDVPGMLLGRQVFSRLGSVTFDFPTSSLEVTAAAPTAAPAGMAEAQLLLLDMHILLVPVTKVVLNASDFASFHWLGGRYKAGMAVTKRTYLKSGKRPSELDELDDPDQGLKMVFFDSVDVGGNVTQGVGGLVLAANPPDPDLAQIIDGTGFEIGGYVNLALMKEWKMTWVPSAGKLYLSSRKP